MERKNQHNRNQIEQDLFQYEMGIELGAEIEQEKRKHQKEFDRERASGDFNATIQSIKEIANNSYICVKRYPRDIFFYGIMLNESEF